MQCVELLDAHPGVSLVRVLGRAAAGQRFSDVVPGSGVDLEVAAGTDVGACDVVMAALPHTVAASRARGWLEAGVVVIDLSADFRIRNAATWERAYGIKHPDGELCEQAVYALPELARADLPTADLIAMPGCYPTASLLATVPAVRAALVDPDVIIDAKSGVSGAGRSPSLTAHFAEVNESVSAYAVEGHRHKSEIAQELDATAGTAVQVTFVPHLVPMTRGILATAYLRPRATVTVHQMVALYQEFCDGHPCLRYSPGSPATKSVASTNIAAVNVSWQDGVAVVTVAIDNLVRGAAGQAVQALNLRFGLDEVAGLPLRATWP
jgi:N-acetyl-gamma-glutamyl-phosphate reductase